MTATGSKRIRLQKNNRKSRSSTWGEAQKCLHITFPGDKVQTMKSFPTTARRTKTRPCKFQSTCKKRSKWRKAWTRGDWQFRTPICSNSRELGRQGDRPPCSSRRLKTAKPGTNGARHLHQPCSYFRIRPRTSIGLRQNLRISVSSIPWVRPRRYPLRELFKTPLCYQPLRIIHPKEMAWTFHDWSQVWWPLCLKIQGRGQTLTRSIKALLPLLEKGR